MTLAWRIAALPNEGIPKPTRAVGAAAAAAPAAAPASAADAKKAGLAALDELVRGEIRATANVILFRSFACASQDDFLNENELEELGEL